MAHRPIQPRVEPGCGCSRRLAFLARFGRRLFLLLLFRCELLLRLSMRLLHLLSLLRMLALEFLGARGIGLVLRDPLMLELLLLLQSLPLLRLLRLQGLLLLHVLALERGIGDAR